MIVNEIRITNINDKYVTYDISDCIVKLIKDEHEICTWYNERIMHVEQTNEPTMIVQVSGAVIYNAESIRFTNGYAKCYNTYVEIRV
jgi:hypothetical protein